MLGEAEGQAALVRRRFPHAADVLVGADFHGVEAVELGGIVKKVIVMHGLSHKVPRARLDIKVHQRVGVEFLRFPEGAEVLIAEFGGVAVVPEVVKVLGGTLDVHIPGVPVAEHGDGLGAPVGPDAELGV